MIVYTMGFTKKSAEEFFTLILNNNIKLLIDIRLNNNSQLAGFTKGRDLPYFLKKICDCEYAHEEYFAPDKDLLDGYKKGEISWDEYEIVYQKLYKDRKMGEWFNEKYLNYDKVLLLCTEPTPEKCHRRLLAEYIESDYRDVKIIHL